jgi:hypothetical protein
MDRARSRRSLSIPFHAAAGVGLPVERRQENGADMTQRLQERANLFDPGFDVHPLDQVQHLVPMLREIRVAVADLRYQLEHAVAELRADLAGKRKSHFTVEEVGALAGRAPYTVRTWIKLGLIKAIRVAGTGPKGRLLVPREELEKVVNRGSGADIPAVTID